MAVSFKNRNRSNRGNNRGNKRHQASAAVKIQPEKLSLVIDHVGSAGDGVAFTNDNRKIYVPYTLTGESCEVETFKKQGEGLLARVISISEPSVNRITPSCEHFTKCGGCAVQHMDDTTYNAFKRAQITSALSRQGFEDDIVDAVKDVVVIGAESRRRCALKFKYSSKKVILGYHGRGGHELIDIKNCNVLSPVLTEAFDGVRDVIYTIYKLVEKLSNSQLLGDVTLTDTDSGLDVFIALPFDALSLEMREVFTEFAIKNNCTRVVVKLNDFNDPVFQKDVPVVDFDGVKVPLSSGCFLQASQKSDALLSGMVVDALRVAFSSSKKTKKRRKVADLFCGRGTLTLPLSAEFDVCGVEADILSLEALSSAANLAKRPVGVLQANLFSDPLQPDVLNEFDAIVLDPPRAGAATQSATLADSKVNEVVYVSCNPASFARDARKLVDGGYMLKSITPVDQFMWSSHVEVVGVFSRR